MAMGRWVSNNKGMIKESMLLTPLSLALSQVGEETTEGKQ
jgi:hypothetical protein